MQPIDTQEALQQFISTHPLALVYFYGTTCATCFAIQGEIEKILQDFPQIAAAEISAEECPALAASWQIFSVPVLLVFTAQKEALRLGRHLNLAELRQQLQRYCEILTL